MSRIPSFSGRHAAALLLALSAALITACGGGGSAGDPPAAPLQGGETATAYAAGPITGFGSVIVNGIRYDDSSAEVTDDEGRNQGRDKLRLGMSVEVDGNQVDHGKAVAKALRIRFGSEIVGPVAAFDAAAGTLQVLGQTVVVTATTVFDDSLTGDLAALAGTVIEVHAQYDAATGRYTAWRIEPAADAPNYKLRGVVAGLTPTTFTLGGQVINYAGLLPADLPPNLANGTTVRVRLQKVQVGGQWVAISVRQGVRKVDDREEADLRGAITVWASATDFEINGLKVDARSAAFPDGMPGVVLGAMVEVEGRIVGGVLVANKVELDARHAMDRHGPELHGAIGGLDKTAKTFKLRGMTVSYAGTVTYKNGTEADLANGRKVEVKGTPGADRKTLAAASISFED